MSSTIFAVCGSSSLSVVPDFPAGLKLKMEGATGRVDWPEVMPVMRWPMRMDSGKSVPFLLVRFGLWSNRSICEGAPDWCRYMMRFALGGKLGKPSNPPVLGSKPSAAAKPSLASNAASAGMPRATPAVLRRKKWRRVMDKVRSFPVVFFGSIIGQFPSALLLGYGFVEIQDDACHGRPGREFTRVKPGIAPGCANGEQLRRLAAVQAVIGKGFLRRHEQYRAFPGIGDAPRSQAEGIVDAPRRGFPALS